MNKRILGLVFLPTLALSQGSGSQPTEQDVIEAHQDLYQHALILGSFCSDSEAKMAIDEANRFVLSANNRAVPPLTLQDIQKSVNAKGISGRSKVLGGMAIASTPLVYGAGKAVAAKAGNVLSSLALDFGGGRAVTMGIAGPAGAVATVGVAVGGVIGNRIMDRHEKALGKDLANLSRVPHTEENFANAVNAFDFKKAKEDTRALALRHRATIRTLHSQEVAELESDSAVLGGLVDFGRDRKNVAPELFENARRLVNRQELNRMIVRMNALASACLKMEKKGPFAPQSTVFVPESPPADGH